MNRTGLVYHSDYTKHLPYPGNPEVPERITSTYEHLKKTKLLDKLTLLTPKPAAEDDILQVHSREHLDYVRNLSERGYGPDDYVNSDYYVSPDTYKTALLAAGGAKLAAESVWDGVVDNAFALIRPPGHHASKYPAGFCYFHNTAVAIRHLQREHGLKRAAVFDWDAHAGNGTMNLFWRDPSVLKISVHQDPASFYPGTGFTEQIGEGEGLGYCMNVPVPAGTGDPDYLHILDEFAIPKIRKYRPEIIFVAAGQDSHRGDGMSGLELTDKGYSAMTMRLMDAADELCNGRLVLVLEGGYNLRTLPATHHAIISTLMGVKKQPKIKGKVLDSTKEVLQQLTEHLAGTPMGD